MNIDPNSRSVNPDEVAIHCQDPEGILISLSDATGWHWISNDCAAELLELLESIRERL